MDLSLLVPVLTALGSAITLGAAVVGVTEFSKRLLPSYVTGYVTPVVAVVIGVVAGYFGLLGATSIGNGVDIALAAVGFHSAFVNPFAKK